MFSGFRHHLLSYHSVLRWPATKDETLLLNPVVPVPKPGLVFPIIPFGILCLGQIIFDLYLSDTNFYNLLQLFIYRIPVVLEAASSSNYGEDGDPVSCEDTDGECFLAPDLSANRFHSALRSTTSSEAFERVLRIGGVLSAFIERNNEGPFISLEFTPLIPDWRRLVVENGNLGRGGLKSDLPCSSWCTLVRRRLTIPAPFPFPNGDRERREGRGRPPVEFGSWLSGASLVCLSFDGTFELLRRDIDELLGLIEYSLLFNTGVDSCGGDPDEDGGVIIGGRRLMIRALSLGSRRYRARLKAELI